MIFWPRVKVKQVRENGKAVGIEVSPDIDISAHETASLALQERPIIRVRPMILREVTIIAVLGFAFIFFAAARTIPGNQPRVGKTIKPTASGVEFLSLELERMERGQ